MPVVEAKRMVSIENFEKLKTIVGSDYILADQESIQHYGHDETEKLQYYPELILKPASTTEIAAIMQLCNENNIHITPRGAGTGLSGGALPHLGGVVLSTERLNKN